MNADRDRKAAMNRRIEVQKERECIYMYVNTRYICTHIQRGMSIDIVIFEH